MLTADVAQLDATLQGLLAQGNQKESLRDGFAANMSAQQALIDVSTERLAMLNTLFDKDVSSGKQVLDVLQQVRQAETTRVLLNGNLADAVAAAAVLDTEIAKTREGLVADNTEKLTTAQRNVDDLVQQLAKADVKVSDMTLTALVASTVQASSVTTIGQVVTTDQELMNVVPDGSSLEIEAYVLNQDIGFVREGQEAVIKIDSFPYTRYGSIAGKVSHVATDAITGNLAQQNQLDPSKPASGSLKVTSAAQRTEDLVFPILSWSRPPRPRSMSRREDAF